MKNFICCNNSDLVIYWAPTYLHCISWYLMNYQPSHGELAQFTSHSVTWPWFLMLAPFQGWSYYMVCTAVPIVSMFFMKSVATTRLVNVIHHLPMSPSPSPPLPPVSSPDLLMSTMLPTSHHLLSMKYMECTNGLVLLTLMLETLFGIVTVPHALELGIVINSCPMSPDLAISI